MPIPCGSTREAVCPPCADKARGLRMQQCREGWHRDHRTRPARPADRRPLDQDDEDQDDEPTTRMTRRGGCGPPAAGRTRRTCPGCRWPRPPSAAPSPPRTGGSSGRRCSSPSPCPPTARSGPAPASRSTPRTYDYRRAALDALHFSKLLDRFVQNLRRCAGYRGAVLRRRRTPSPARPAPARRDPRHHPPGVSVRSSRPPTSSCGGPRRPTRLRPPAAGLDRRRLPRPRHRRMLPTWAEALDQARRRPGRRAGARDAVRQPGRRRPASSAVPTTRTAPSAT